MRPKTVSVLAEKHGLRLPQALLDDSPVMVPATERGWFRFQRLYDAARACVRDESDMRRILNEAVEDDAQEGSGRLEIQVDPTSYAPFVGGITPAMEIVVDEAKIAAAQHGISVGIIVAASRMRHPMDARTLARLAVKFSGSGDGQVIGFGLSNDERRGLTEDFAPAFGIARAAGLISVPHGGELLGPDHIRVVSDALSPARLGHGVRATEDPRIVDELVAKEVALEINPASNVSLGVYPDDESVPLPALYETGLKLALGADDPLLFKSRVVDQYQVARSVHGFSDHQLARLATDSIKASAADNNVKRHLLEGVKTWLSN